MSKRTESKGTEQALPVVSECDAATVAALLSTLEQVGERVRLSHNRRGGNVSPDAVADAVSEVLTECASTGEYVVSARDAVRRVSTALKREQRAMSAALGLTRERGTRTDSGRLTTAAVAALTATDRVALANRYASTDIATADRADAVLAAVTLAALPPIRFAGLRKRVGGAGASESTILASHSAESTYYRETRDAAIAAACDSIGNAYAVDKRGESLATLRAACDAVESATGERVTIADLLTANYCAPVYRKPRGESVRMESPRRVNVANVARSVSYVLTGSTASTDRAAVESLRRALTDWADNVRTDASKRERAALATPRRSERVRRGDAWQAWQPFTACAVSYRYAADSPREHAATGATGADYVADYNGSRFGVPRGAAQRGTDLSVPSRFYNRREQAAQRLTDYRNRARHAALVADRERAARESA